MLARSILILLLAGFFFSASATEAPSFRSYRGLGMGGAYVAVVDDREAVHINPAGLALISYKGDHPMLDSDRYWREPWEVRWNFSGLDLPWATAPELYRFQNKYRDMLTKANIDTLANHQDFFDDLWKLDRKQLPINWHGEGEFAVQNFGFGGWGEVKPEVHIDHGAVVPQVGISLYSVQTIDVAVAQSFGSKKDLNLGIGYRLMALSHRSREIDVLKMEHIQDTAESMARGVLSDILNPGEWGHAVNLGAIWFQNPEVRWGFAAQNLGMKLDSGWVTPDLALGADWSPWIVQKNDRWARKVNISLQWSDIMGAHYGREYMPLSHIDMGVEWCQTIFPHLLKGRVSSGLHQGYPTFGFGGDLFTVLHMDALTYAEEKGVYLGQLPQRYYTIKFGMGL